jgi:F-type H+-transporting ATPase subunit b
VLNVIEQRQAGINEKLQQAEDLKSQGDVLLTSYNNRLSDWEKEKQIAIQTLDQDIQQERAVRLQQLKDELESERKKAAVIEQRKQTELQQQAESAAIFMAARFAAKLFSDLSGPEIESRLIKLFIEQLQALPEQRKLAIQSGSGEATEVISIDTAYPVNPSDSRELETALRQIVGDDVSFNYNQSPELVAGLKVLIGAFALQANLKDELNDFARFSHDSSTH